MARRNYSIGDECDLVTIIIPTFNDSKERLTKTIQSALKQTHLSLEIIVSDDGSEKPFSGLQNNIYDNRIVWLSNNHEGVAHTRNSAINIANGIYVAFLDTGDWWEPTKIERQVAKFKVNKDLVFVYSNIITHDDYNRINEVRGSAQGDLYRLLLIGQPVVGSCSSVLTMTKILREIGGFYTDNDIPEDKELWLRLSKLGDVDFVDEFLVHLDISASGRSSDPIQKMDTYRRFIEMYANELKQENLDLLAWSNYYLMIADKFFSRGCFYNGMRFVLYAFNKKFTRLAIVRLFSGMLSVFGPRVYSYSKYIYRSIAR